MKERKNKLERKMAREKSKADFLADLKINNVIEITSDGMDLAKKHNCIREYKKTILQNQKDEAYFRMFVNDFGAKTSKDIDKTISEKNLDGSSSKKTVEQKEIVFEEITDNKSPVLEGANYDKKDKKIEGYENVPRQKLTWPDGYVSQIVDAYNELLENMKANLGEDSLSFLEEKLCFEQACRNYEYIYPNHPSNRIVVEMAERIVFPDKYKK